VDADRKVLAQYGENLHDKRGEEGGQRSRKKGQMGRSLLLRTGHREVRHEGGKAEKKKDEDGRKFSNHGGYWGAGKNGTTGR